jgi:hypothetical protein
MKVELKMEAQKYQSEIWVYSTDCEWNTLLPTRLCNLLINQLAN